MKRFLLFGSPDNYYARGGWRDFLGTFDTKTEAVATGEKYQSEEIVRYQPYEWEDDEDAPWKTLDWWHVVDADEKKIVARSKSEPYEVHEGDLQIREQK